MHHADETLLSVIVLELGSAWPTWLADYQKHAPNSIVIVQSSDESGADFAHRIRRKMAEIATRDAKIHAGLLVSNGSLDPKAIAAREQICSALLRVMLQKQRGELVIAMAAMASEAVRHELFTLAGRLCDELHGTEVSVRVRFGGTQPAAIAGGVMKSAASTAEVNHALSERASTGSR